MPDFADLSLQAGRVFNPNSPVSERDVFAGRVQQLIKVLDVVNEPGQHAIIYGERGVGKTSLANVVAQFLGDDKELVEAPRVACDAGDSFDSVWRKLFWKIEITRTTNQIGFAAQPRPLKSTSESLLGADPATPGSVNRALQLLSHKGSLILIFDEFDRLRPEARRWFADTIKSLADDGLDATVVLVGVADSVNQLILEHQSVSRQLIQIYMPRMSDGEIRQILMKGLTALGMSISADAQDRIALLSQGLPHYTHLLGRHSAREALKREALDVGPGDVVAAVSRGIEDAQHTISTAYHDAIQSPRPDNLFADVLLACALAKADDRGTFAAQDVRIPLRLITGKNYDIPSFGQHLNEFSDAKRKNVLTKLGERRRYRFRFSDPLLQPFVIMQGVKRGRLAAAYAQAAKADQP